MFVDTASTMGDLGRLLEENVAQGMEQECQQR